MSGGEHPPTTLHRPGNDGMCHFAAPHRLGFGFGLLRCLQQSTAGNTPAPPAHTQSPQAAPPLHPYLNPPDSTRLTKLKCCSEIHAAASSHCTVLPSAVKYLRLMFAWATFIWINTCGSESRRRGRDRGRDRGRGRGRGRGSGRGRGRAARGRARGRSRRMTTNLSRVSEVPHTTLPNPPQPSTTSPTPTLSKPQQLSTTPTLSNASQSPTSLRFPPHSTVQDYDAVAQGTNQQAHLL